MDPEESDDFPLFQLTKVATSFNIRYSACATFPNHNVIALVLQSGDILLYTPSCSESQNSIQHIPWFEGTKKQIQAVTFDPTFGMWLLVICYDTSLYVVPVLAPSTNINLDSDWSLEDITSLEFFVNETKLNGLIPSALAWWERVDSGGRLWNIVIVGGTNGEIILANLHSGCLLGRTDVDGSVKTIQVCKENNKLNHQPVFLLITNNMRKQWKLVLEDRKSEYSWPFPFEQVRTESTASLISASGSEDSVTRSSMTPFPLARARLQGLKQLSVEKLANLRQKFTETRNHGLNVTVKQRGSSSSEESIPRCEPDRDNPKITILNDTYYCLQSARGRDFITGFYAPAEIFTVYGVALNMVPCSIHKLASSSTFVLLTDWLLFAVDKQRLSVVSYFMSQCCMDGDKQLLNKDLNPDSLLQEFTFSEDEEIKMLYRITPDLQSFPEDSAVNPHANKNVASDQHRLEQCVLVTNRGVYNISIRKSPKELVLAYVLESKKMEKAEKLCKIFGLHLQQLLEYAAKNQLEKGLLPSALSLYKLARCRPMKSILNIASAGFTEQLLYLTTTFLQSTQLSQSEGLNLANLTVLSFTEQYLRQKKMEKLESNFKAFLRNNYHYDEGLAVNVIGQSGLFNILSYLCDQRGLYTQMLNILIKIINFHQVPRLDYALCKSFWQCLSCEMLSQSFTTNPELAKQHLQFVLNNLQSLDEQILQRCALLYDPSQPLVRPALKKLMFDVESCSSDLAQVDHQFSLNDWLIGYITLCLHLNFRRKKSGHMEPYNKTLIKKCLHHDSNVDHNKDKSSISTHVISAGNAHVALVLNGCVYVWGHSANGCLGIGPVLSQIIAPTQVPFFPLLGIQVSNVSCGKAHTLALTDNGVYSWGSSTYGQLGLGDISQSPEPRLVQKLINETVILVSAGQYHSLALTDRGRLYSWGWGVHGQLGHHNVDDYYYPSQVQALSSEICIFCCGGHAHSLVLTSTGKVWAFGSSVFGQLGTGSNAKSSNPVQIFGLPEKILFIATGYFHNLALAASNRLYTWGSSPQVLRLQAQAQKKARVQFHYQQQHTSGNVQTVNAEEETASDANHDANDKDNSELEPKQKNTQLKFLQTSCFSSHNSEMILSPSTEIKGLPSGKMSTEQLASTFTNTNKPVTSGTLVGVDDGLSHLSPTLVDTSHVEGKIMQISCGCHHSALLTDKGHVYTWGRNLDAQLGNGARVKEAIYPTRIFVGNSVEMKNIDCGGDFTIGVDTGGLVWGWGSNHQGQLGHPQIEEPTRAGLDGCLYMLKTSKRVIKLPHGSLNTVDIPKPIPSLPAVKIEFMTIKNDLNKLTNLRCLNNIEQTPHGINTLHYALIFFHGFYDSNVALKKCIELEDFYTAALLCSLNKKYDIAMGYQLKAALDMPLLKGKSDPLLINTEELLSKLETNVFIDSEAEIGLNVVQTNYDKEENVPPVDTVKLDEETEDKNNSEMHIFVVQGGTEEMSSQHQDSQKSDTKLDNIDSRSKTPDTLTSSSFDDCSMSFNSPGKNDNDDINKNVESFVHPELQENLLNIVEMYIKQQCKNGPETSLGTLLKQAFIFWTNHNLPLCKLEALLLSNWSLVSYALGVLLLGNAADEYFDPQKVLSLLSTEFNLQLCSAMVQHSSYKGNCCPEMLKLLSGLSWSNHVSTKLDQVIMQLSCAQQSQPFIDIDFIPEIDGQPMIEEIVSFSCGHSFNGSSEFDKLTNDVTTNMDEKSMSNTVQVLRIMYQQPHAYNAACPKCLAEYIHSEIKLSE